MGDIYKAATQVWIFLGDEKLQPMGRGWLDFWKWLQDLDDAVNHPSTSESHRRIKNLIKIVDLPGKLK
jgi:hypothetical protein